LSSDRGIRSALQLETLIKRMRRELFTLPHMAQAYVHSLFTMAGQRLFSARRESDKFT